MPHPLLGKAGVMDPKEQLRQVAKGHDLPGIPVRLTT